MITVRDVLSVAGEPVSLEIEVERRIVTFIDPPVEGAAVEVVGVGTALTDARGLASVPLGTPAAGTHRFRVRGPGGEEAEALVCVSGRDHPVFITDIDGTIADVSSLGFILRRGEGESVRPMEGAPAALREIARRMTVLYLTARDHVFISRTKGWLAANGFPEGPLYARKVRFWSATPRNHKRARLAELRPRFSDLRWGVGDLRWDAAAYAAHGIPAILLSPRELPGLPPGTLCLPSWRAILDVTK